MIINFGINKKGFSLQGPLRLVKDHKGVFKVSNNSFTPLLTNYSNINKRRFFWTELFDSIRNFFDAFLVIEPKSDGNAVNHITEQELDTFDPKTFETGLKYGKSSKIVLKHGNLSIDTTNFIKYNNDLNEVFPIQIANACKTNLDDDSKKVLIKTFFSNSLVSSTVPFDSVLMNIILG